VGWPPVCSLMTSSRDLGERRQQPVEVAGLLCCLPGAYLAYFEEGWWQGHPSSKGLLSL
jgi:hypothetical protein